MSSWDPFIIYLVDPHIETANPPGTNSGKPPPAPGFPPPPINVIPLPSSGQGPPICYNQPVVLQCLNTAVVSPVMVIRKVDRGTTVVGGGQSTSSYSATGGKMDPTIETLGDPVSQLHKIAFEVLENPNAPAPVAENRDVTTPGHSGHFLGCLNEDVGLRKPVGARQWVANSMSGPSTPTTPITPMGFPATSDPNKMLGEPLNQASMAAAAQAAAQTRFSLSQKRSGNMSPSGSMAAGPSSSSSSLQYSNNMDQSSNNQISAAPDSGDEDGGKQKRPRRVSSSVVVIQKDRSGTAAKNRRRGQSLSIVGMQNQLNSQQQQQQHLLSTQYQHQQQQAAMQSSFSLTSPNNESRSHLRRTSSFANSLTNSETSSLGIPAGAMWTVDVHDSDIWTIVGTDIARHTFYLPNKLVGGVKAKTDTTDQGIAHLINVPAPATPITPLPILHSFTSPNNSSSKKVGNNSSTARPPNKLNQSGSNDYVTLIGENLTNDLFIYFGDWRSTRVTIDNQSTMYCEPPPAFEEFGLPRGRVPIILVRRDGVVFPTSLIYSC